MNDWGTYRVAILIKGMDVLNIFFRGRSVVIETVDDLF